MHLADRMELPGPLVARPFRGAGDLPAMLPVLAAHRTHIGDPDRPSLEQMRLTYSHLTDCDPDLDIAIVETTDGEVVGYARTGFDDLASGGRDLVVFGPIRPDVLTHDVFAAVVRALEQHLERWIPADRPARYLTWCAHPGPDRPPTGEAAWLEELGYTATEWGATLVRPTLDDIPERNLPDGVEIRPVTEEQVRPILEAHWEAFRGEWDFREPTESDFVEMIEDPRRDITLWKVAWAGDQIVGQVKPFIDREDNAERGIRRGYTEHISTHRDWRNRGIAGTLLAMSLRELRDRGMTDAALSVDTNNPGGAFQLYTSLGFELQRYEVVYTRPA